MIFWWFESTVQVAGKTDRNTLCEFCQSLYRHTVSLVRTSTAEGLLPPGYERVSALTKRAEADMQKSLGTHPGKTPCPNCGSYQRAMFWPMARKHYEWTISAAGFAFFCAAMSFLTCGIAISKKDDPNTNPFRYLIFLVPVACLLVGISIIWARQRWIAAFNPNIREMLKDRFKLARSQAILLKSDDPPTNI